MMELKRVAEEICRKAVERALPDAAVRRALEEIQIGKGRLFVIAVGKAGWEMGRTAAEVLGDRIDTGIVITKYHHSRGEISGFAIFEAGHPVLDENGVKATEYVLEAVKDLSKEDQVLLLLSGGGSALFEKPLLPLEELKDISQQLLACGADIVEINTIRKRLSAVKGGRFAKACAPAQVHSVLLSDVVGDHPGMIASGPACEDASTCEEALELVEKYKLRLSERVLELLGQETPKRLDNICVTLTGGVSLLCRFVAEECEKRGYPPVILTDSMDCEAREAGRFLASAARYHRGKGHKIALIAGGETIVHLTGSGKGGRNQELALAAAEGIAGLEGVAIAAMGSDGTDGPTDAAGGCVDGYSKNALEKQGIRIYEVLRRNDAYHGLEQCGGLIVTGSTGTNVNDIALALIAPPCAKRTEAEVENEDRGLKAAGKPASFYGC
jgi:glycerate 2-kinase